MSASKPRVTSVIARSNVRDRVEAMEFVSGELSKHWEIVTDREGQRAAVHGIAKSRTQLRD